jgi:hypothetical protein
VSFKITVIPAFVNILYSTLSIFGALVEIFLIMYLIDIWNSEFGRDEKPDIKSEALIEPVSAD